MRVRFVRADPAGNITLLVTSPVDPALRTAAARALLACTDAEQVGFLVPPVLGGDCRLEMMGGEFCGNALRALGRLWAEEHPGTWELMGEISGCAHPLRLTIDGDRVEAQLPLPESVVEYRGLPCAVFPGIVHALRYGEVPTEAEARHLTAALCGHFDLPAAGVMTVSEGRMVPAVYVRDTDTLFFESSCASGTGAAAAILSQTAPEGESAFTLVQPGGILDARARRKSGELTALSITGSVTLEGEKSVEIP